MSHDKIFIESIICSLKINVDSFYDEINYIDKIQKITGERTEAVALREEMLSNLRTRLEEHQQNMRTMISELNRIQSRSATEEVKRPAILDVCDVRSGFLDYSMWLLP